MITKKTLQKLLPQSILAVVLFGLFLGFMALRQPSPLKAPKIVPSSAISNSLFYASNREFSVRLGERNTNKPVIEYSLPEGNKISFSYKNVKGKLVAPEEKDNTVTFKDVSANVDLKYTTLPHGLKEEIILKKQANNNVFYFDLNTTKAFPGIQTDTILTGTFYDKFGKYLFHFEKPYAIDAKGARTENVSIQIIKNLKNNSYSLELAVDRAWLESRDRAYPISVDPTIVHDTLSEFATGQFNRSKDTGINTTNPTALATGGTISYVNGYAIHTFTSSGTFTPSQSLNTEYLVVAGGGGGGGVLAGTGFNVNAGTYTITVGGGGTGAPYGGRGGDGGNSVFSTLTSIGGGGGGGYSDGGATVNGSSGGSGGGGAEATGLPGGTGTYGTGTSGQGNNGGVGLGNGATNDWAGGGGGGAGAVGGNAYATQKGGGGGIGVASDISGISTYYGGGGGGGGGGNVDANGGAGGQGGGGKGTGAYSPTQGVAGTANTGGGGGGSRDQAGAAGGSGIVIIRYYVGISYYPFIQSYFQELRSDPYTVGLWHLNEASGNALDSSGNSNTGTPTATTVTTGFFGNSRTFADNTTDRIVTTNNIPQQPITFSFWVKRSGVPSGTRALIENDTGTAGQVVFSVLMNNAGKLYLEKVRNNIAIDTTVTGSTVVTDGNWHHVAAVLDSANYYLYIDGKLDAYTNIGNATTPTFTPILIGADRNSVTGYRFSCGCSMDEVEVYGRALSAEEVRLSASRRPYSIYTSDVLDLTNVSSWNSFKWNTFGLATGDGETATASATSSLVAQWNFNETSGTTADNAEGTAALDGTLTNFASTTSQDQAAGTGWTSANKRWGTGALMFDGTDDFVTLNDNNALDLTTEITIEAWINSNNLSSSRTILGKRDVSLAEYNYAFRTNGTELQLYFIGSGTLQVIGTSGANLLPGKWYFVAATYNGTSGKIYINGIEQKSSCTTGTCNMSMTPDDNPLSIGRPGNLTSQYFSGIIDSPKIYNRTLTSSEVLSNYNSSRLDLQTRVGTTLDANDGSWEAWRPTTGEAQIHSFDTPLTQITDNLISYWKLDETSGTRNDAQSTNNLTDTGTVTSSTGIINSAGSFSRATTQYLGCTDATCGGTSANGLDTAPTQSISYSAWIKTSSSGLTQTIMSKKNINWDTTAGYSMMVNTSDYVRCVIADGTTNVGPSTSPSTISDGNWHQIVCVADRSADTLSLYLDGSFANSVSTASVTNTMDNSDDFRIGAQGNAGNRFEGLIDEVGVWSKVLSQEEITSLYNSSSPLGLLDGSDLTNIPQDGGINLASDSAIFIEGTGSQKIISGVPKVDRNTVALWHLDETGGTGAYIHDSTTNANHGTPTGTTLIEGISGKARSFSATDNISIGNISIVDNLANVTVDAWIYPTTQTTAHYRVFSETSVLYVGQYGNQASFYMGNGTSWIVSDVTGGTLNLNQWNYVSWVKSGSTYHVYINGVQTKTANTAPATLGTSSNGNYISTSDGTTQPWSGYIDEVRISNTARSAEEVAEAYRMGRDHHISETISSTDLSSSTKLPFYIASDRLGTFFQMIIGESSYANYESDVNTVGLWHLEEQAGTTAYLKDSSGNGNHGTPTGTTYVQGKIGKARNFVAASSQSIAVGSPSLANISFTLEAWITRASIGAAHYIFGQGSAATNAGLHFGYLSTNVIRFGFYSNDLDTTTTYTDSNTWHYLVGTYDASANVKKIYYDGVLVASGTTTADYQGSGVLTIGNVTWAASTYYNGIIDEPRISSVARTADEIRQAYEIGSRTHNITFDFKAKLGSGNLITGSSDLGFTVDETAYGATLAAGNLFLGDKIIIKENYDGTEYIAQGTVSAVNSSTGAVTVTAWDTGSTFPSSGYTVDATVFKWQREYFDITSSLSTQRDAITRLTYRITDGSLGANIWLDDLRSSTGYLSNPYGSTITSSTSNQYFQYRAIFSQNDLSATSSALTSVSLDYTSNVAPNLPSLDLPTDTATNQSLLPILETTATDNDSDVLKYKIIVCTDAGMTTDCKTFDQTASTTGWSAASYASGVQGVYTVQADDILNTNTTYYWKSSAIDPAGTNTWGPTQTTPYSFTTTNAPIAPENLLTNGVTDNPNADIAGIYFNANHYDQDSDTADYYQIEVNTNNAFTGTVMWDSTKTIFGTPIASGSATPNISYAGSALSTNTTYYWRIKFWDSNGAVSPLSATAQFTTNTTPTVPSLDSPANTLASAVPVATVFKTTGTDADGDSLKYKITVCTDSIMTTGCQTFDQTVSTTGWSAASYASGAQATYTVQPAGLLDPDTIYYWKTYSIDQDGLNVWSSTQASPFNFLTSVPPNNPTPNSPVNTATNQSLNPTFSVTAYDGDEDSLKYKIVLCTNALMTTDCQTFDQTVSQTGWSATSYPAGIPAYYTVQTALLPGTTYYWQTYAIDFDGSQTWSPASTAISFTTSIVPNTVTLLTPTDTSTDVTITPVFTFSTTDSNGDYLRYKLLICTNVSMSSGCQTFDQTTSQTGWSGQNTQTNTAYTSGTTATYTSQSSLSINTIYYWQAFAIDPAGSNTWSSAPTPFSFTTKANANMPAPCTLAKAVDNSNITINWTDTSTNEDNYQVWKAVDGGLPAQLGGNLAANTIQLVDSAISINHYYAYLIRGLRIDGGTTLYGDWCSTSGMFVGSGVFKFDGLNFSGIKLD